MHKRTSITITPADLVRLDAIVRDRDSSQKPRLRLRTAPVVIAQRCPACPGSEKGSANRQPDPRPRGESDHLIIAVPVP